MAMTLKPADDRMFIISTYLTQRKRELKTKIRLKIKTKTKKVWGGKLDWEWANAGYMLLGEKHTLKLANYLTDILYQCGKIDEFDLIAKKGKYSLHDKSWNKDYARQKSMREYKNPFKIVDD